MDCFQSDLCRPYAILRIGCSDFSALQLCNAIPDNRIRNNIHQKPVDDYYKFREEKD